MRSNFLKIIMGCCLASLFFACSEVEDQSATKEKKEDCSTPETSVINPNGDSELALLMRQMYLDADSIKQLIVNREGTISDDFITELEKVHSAIPTDPEVKTPEFDAFNKSLIAQAKALQEKESDQQEAFNLLVDRCIDCHQSFCPGPIVRIKKLRIVNPIP